MPRLHKTLRLWRQRKLRRTDPSAAARLRGIDRNNSIQGFERSGLTASNYDEPFAAEFRFLAEEIERGGVLVLQDDRLAFRSSYLVPRHLEYEAWKFLEPLFLILATHHLSYRYEARLLAITDRIDVAAKHLGLNNYDVLRLCAAGHLGAFASDIGWRVPTDAMCRLAVARAEARSSVQRNPVEQRRQ